MNTLPMRILHLSDIHFGRDYKRTKLTDPFEKRNEIMNGLISCIENIGEEYKPEHIVVTGDIAWFGKKDEYIEAREWFLKLLKVTGLTGKDLTFCVGNHDVNWNYGQTIDELTDETISAIDEAYKYKNISAYEAPIQEYEQFCQDLGVEPYRYFIDGKVEYSYSVGYKDVAFRHGNIIRFVGFNTSLLSYGKNIREDRMWIGQPQIFDLMDYGILPKKQNCKYSIALIHHAEKFLHLNELCEYDGREATLPLLMKNVDLVLCGHTETGGVPVLKTQEGGGKILSAGATYYNDEHPNSFSLIYIFHGGQMVFDLYVYEGEWKRYQKEGEPRTIRPIIDIPEIGDIKEECTFVVVADNQKYSIPMNVISVYENAQDGAYMCRLENNKDVTRGLKIVCEGTVPIGKAIAHVTLPRKKEKDSSSMLALEKYTSFLKNVVSRAKYTEFYILSNSGHKILSGNTMQVGEDVETNELGIQILEKIVKIEEYFGIRLVRPDDIWEADLPKIDFLVTLIEDGYSEKIIPDYRMSISVNDYEWMKELYENACEGKKCSMHHKGNYIVNLYGKKISICGLKIFMERFEVDIDDLKYKLETYREGDVRSIIFHAEHDSKIYYVLDKENFEEETLDSECLVINVLHTGINTDFISEQE